MVPDLVIWKHTWKFKITPKLKHFLCRVIRDAIATKENLFKRGLVKEKDKLCPICLSEVESIKHLLLECSHTRPVWLGCPLTIISDFNGSCSFNEWWNDLCKGRKGSEGLVMEQCLVVVVCWQI